MTDDTQVLGSVREPDEESDLIRAALDSDYEILEELGRGGMAVVYRALERSLEREVAIKVLPLARTFDQEFVARFQREARLSASLEHPHIVPVYRVGQSGRVNFFVMKFVRGPSLSDLLANEGRMEPVEVERLLLEVSDALDHAHGQGVVHRDVKPDNIMRDQTGRYVVMDFGIAKSPSGTQLTETGGSIGTPKYMSPEQAKGAELDGGSDFYSLGVVAYRSLVGRPPFEGDDPLAILYAHLHDPVPEPALNSEGERRTYEVIRRLLAKDGAERPCSADDVREALSEPGLSIAMPPSASTVRRRTLAPAEQSAGYALIQWLRGRGRRFWISASAVAAVLAVVIGRDGAAAQCRAAIPNSSEDERAVLLEPPGTVTLGAEIGLDYVVCGLPDDQLFTTQVRIRPADAGGVVGRVGRFFGGGSDPFRESWDDGADGFATSRKRMISPSDLAPGSYRITLQVEDSDGRDAEASHDFTIVAR
jgi:predicted Ser/Thr protein kinase